MAVADPRFVSGPPKPPPKWVQAGLSKSQWDKLDADGKRLALLKAQDQGINPTGDEALPFTWGPLLANIAKYGVNEAGRQLLKRRLVKDSAGKPQPFYHGTTKKFKGDIKPQQIFEKPSKPELWMSTSPKTADEFTRFGLGEVGKLAPNARIYKKFLRGKGSASAMKESPGLHIWGPHTNKDFHAVISDPKVLVSPWEIAPKSLPNMAPLTAPALMESMISPYEIAAPPMPNFLPYLAPPVIGSQQ